jgi:hypothetical protein
MLPDAYQAHQKEGMMDGKNTRNFAAFSGWEGNLVEHVSCQLVYRVSGDPSASSAPFQLLWASILLFVYIRALESHSLSPSVRIQSFKPPGYFLGGRCYVSYKASDQRTISSIRFKLPPHPEIIWLPNHLPFWHLQTVVPFYTVVLEPLLVAAHRVV